MPIEGKIDRVDINGDEIWLIDYKSGNLDTQSFQLAFYEMLYLAEFHQEAKGYFYSLKDNKFESSNKKIDELSQILNELKELSGSQICFNQNTKNCSQWCPYQTLCLRELR